MRLFDIFQTIITGVFKQRQPDDISEGFPSIYLQSQKLDMDVNDYTEQIMGWSPALPILEKTVFRYITNTSNICEIGPGTGRFSRYILEKNPLGTLVLVDQSEWIMDFLKEYLSIYIKSNPNHLHFIKNNGLNLDSLEDEKFDIFFINGVFIELKLGVIVSYFFEMKKKLMPNGLIIFDYIDIDLEGGWSYLMQNSNGSGLPNCYTYYNYQIMEKIVNYLGMRIIDTWVYGKSKYLIIKNGD